MYWAKELAKKIIKVKGKKINIATGITPSGHIHIGNMREVMTAELVRREMEVLGAKVRFIYIADDFDRLRKLYPFLPVSFQKYIGWPLVNIPDPIGDCHKSYAEHFLAPFFEVLGKIGVKVEKFSAFKLYKEGFYTEQIKLALENKDKIKKILEEISGRSIPDDWSPYNPLCKSCGKIDEAKVLKEDLKSNRVFYKCSNCHETGWADFSKGEGKLSWRVDWPARWNKFPVDFEPYGKEHATLGGSYDTGKAICEKIFGSPAPYGVGYDLIYLKGFKGKMSSSIGNVISANEFLEIVPPEILRYLFVKTKNDKPIYFDPGIGLLQLVDEYAKLEQKYFEKKANQDEREIYEACQIQKAGKSIPAIPFKHLVNTIQASQGNIKEIERILINTGHKKAISDQKMFDEQITRAKKWLEKYAPDNIKFSILKQTPKVNLDSAQKEMLNILSIDLAKKSWQAEELHNHIYEVGKRLGLSPKETFQPVYQVLIGKDHGPKAGWFIALLDKDFVIKRFIDITK